jgi:transcriptional regulator with XRE-family HTH domain
MNRLRETRTKRGMSQIALYAKTGIWPSILSYIERGYLPPTEAQQERISAALGVKKGRLFPRSKQNSRPGRAAFSSEPGIELSASAQK